MPRLRGVLVPTLLVTTTAWAQVGSSGTVLGCVGSSGKLTAVDETTGSCKAGDVTLSWYTKNGANAAFLAQGSLAGGALAGTYPSPSLAVNAVDSAAIQDGAVTADKLADDVPSRSPGSSTFIPRPGELTPVIECGEFIEDVGSVQITVTSPSRIYAAASVNWTRGSTAMDTLRIRAFLHDATNTRVAHTPLDGISSTDANQPVSVHSSGVLLVDGGAPFVAGPGTYSLHLVATPGGSCQTNQPTSNVTLLQNSLTHILLAPE
jgi:hypothetical protein